MSRDADSFLSSAVTPGETLRIATARDWIRARCDLRPRVGVVLGTGLGAVSRAVRVEADLPFADIPGFRPASAPRHEGRLLLGHWGAEVPAAVLDGRLHAYEGVPLRDVAFPVAVLAALGVWTLVLTATVGTWARDWRVGDLALVADHLNLMGDNPLVGPNDEAFGPRFPDMSNPYDPELRRRAAIALEGLGRRPLEGVYAALRGPTLETRAEYRMLRGMGADMVGMSTVPEVIVARHRGLRVVAIAVVTDLCDPDALEPAEFATFLAAAEGAVPDLSSVVSDLVSHL